MLEKQKLLFYMLIFYFIYFPSSLYVSYEIESLTKQQKYFHSRSNLTTIKKFIKKLGESAQLGFYKIKKSTQQQFDNLKYFQMYSQVFGGYQPELGTQFMGEEDFAYEQFDQCIMEPPIERPYEFCESVKNSQGKQSKIMDFKTGTTTLAFIFKEGIIIAVDSRATMGNFISSEKVRKVIEISDRKLATIAGGAADCQFWQAWLSQQVRHFQLKHGYEPSVAAASRIMVNLINHYKRYGLQMGLMLSGVDEKGSNLFYINTQGSRIKGHLFSVGSGMTYAYGVLDTFYRYDMTLDQAIELGRRAIYHATNRDTASGGVARVFHVHAGGWTEKVAGDDVNKLHYQYQAQKGFEDDVVRGKL